jgi:hypothetical protein
VKRRVSRTRNGRFAVHLPEAERELLVSLTGQLRDLLVSGGDTTTRRLFPPAYADDVERETEYRALVGDELLEHKLASLDVVEETANQSDLDEAQITRWMHAINDLRLVLGTRLDVSEDADPVPLDHEDAPAFAVYDYLTWLLAQVVDALSD